MRFVASLLALGIGIVGVPWGLVAVSRLRFGGGSPFAGVPAPDTWRWERIQRALVEQLTEDTIADLVIRISLAVAWVAVAVFVATVAVEAAHMIRHGGLPMPDVRGLGWSQGLARAVAAGLLVVVPMLTSPVRAAARDGFALGPVPVLEVADALGTTPGSDDRGVEHAAAPTGVVASTGTAAVPYVVRSGDSVFAIAERLAGPDPAAVHAFADRLLELNLGRVMPDGQRFDNAALVDVGWVLEVPPLPAVDAPRADDEHPEARADAHVVRDGETLWSIADDELGDAERWPEIFGINRDRTFDDGRRLDDPSLIHPGWVLDLPADAAATDAVERADDAEPAPEFPGPESGEPQHDGSDVPEAPLDRGAGLDPGPGLDDPANTVVAPAEVAEPGSVEDAGRARPTNSWLDVPAPAPPPAAATGPAPATEPLDERADGLQVLTPARAAMLSAGALTLLAVRRRSQLRRARARTRIPAPPAEVARTERVLRSIVPGDRLLRVDVAVRAAASALVSAGVRAQAVEVGDEGGLVLHATGPVVLGALWEATSSPSRWRLAATVPIELLTEPARQVGAPCPTLVQIGRTLDDGDLYVDLEALEAVEVGGPGDLADAIVTALAATLAGSVLAEVTTLIGVGVDDAAFLGHRRHVIARDAPEAFAKAADALRGVVASRRGTFELRTRATGGEAWEPAVVLVGAAAGTVTPPVERTGLAIVSASPIHGPSSRLEPDGDAWVLRPLGVRCLPVGLTAGHLASLAALVASADAEAEPDGEIPDGEIPDGEIPDGEIPDDDLTLAPVLEACDRGAADPAIAVHAIEPPPLLVRLLGPVAIAAADGRVASFEKSKARELIAWLATHRQRSTRSGARTALWELDVRDATFANVVSEARCTLARLVEPPEGEEWIARTLTEALPLHPLVRTDADLVREAQSAARLQPAELAIATLRPAAELVVGLPFEGAGYLWPEPEGIASQLVLLATSVSAELAAHYLSMGDSEGVFDATGRGLQVLPGHEELIGLRMRAHARAGDLAGVRHEWQQYERVIADDPWSDGEPSPTLARLRRELLAG